MQLWDKIKFLLLEKENNFYKEPSSEFGYCLKQNNTWKSWAMGATVLCVILFFIPLTLSKTYDNPKVENIWKLKAQEMPRIMIMWDEGI